MDEVRDIEELDLKIDSPIWHTRNVWLFSFYFAGMRVSDVLRVKWSDFNDERLYYTMGKNQKVGSLKVPKKVRSILKHYISDKNAEDDFVFPELKKADLENQEDIVRKITTAVKYFNKYLERIATKAEIEKKLTMHIARHTFGNISGDKIPIQMLQKLYRHTSITTTIGYQSNFLYKDADDALEAVINT
jgi:integrase